MKNYLLSILLITCSLIGNSATIVVTNTNDSGPNSLREAVKNANNGDVIRFSPSLIASGSATINLDSTIVMEDTISLTIIGMYNSADTLFISGQNLHQVLNIGKRSSFSNKNVLTIDSLVIINGMSMGSGANPTASGGGVYLKALKVRIKNCVFRNNESLYYGGGVFVDDITGDTGFVYIENCVMKNNRSLAGGGISAGDPNSYWIILSINNSTISSNVSTDKGGGLYCGGYGYSEAIISNSIISNNTGNEGGGVFFDSDRRTASVTAHTNSFVIRKSKIYNNSASLSGGGVSIYKPAQDGLDLLVENSRISNNTAQAGGGINIENQGLVRTKVLRSSIDSNSATLSHGGGIFANLFRISQFDIETSTFYSNSATMEGGGICIQGQANIINAKNSTFFTNNSLTGGNDIDLRNFPSSPPQVLNLSSSIFAGSAGINISSDSIFSNGYNIFGATSPAYSIPSDQTGVNATALNLSSFSTPVGSKTPVLEPMLGSVAIDMGNPLDSSDAQNKPPYFRRDVGAAEYGNSFRIINCSGNYTSPSGKLITASGIYPDTLTSTVTGLDSINLLYVDIITTDLTVNKSGFTINSNDTNSQYQWLDVTNGYSAISGANGRFLTDSNGGTFAVELTKNGCIDTSNSVTIYSTCTAYFFPTQTVPGQVVILDSTFGNNLQYTWYFGDGDSAVSNLPTHNYASSGTYNLCLKIVDLITGCTDTYCDSITVDSTGALRNGFSLKVIRNIASVKEEIIPFDVTIYPNPTFNFSVINFPEILPEISVTVIDVSGKTIINKVIYNTNETRVNTTQLKSGVYFVRIESENKMITKRLIKQ